jgi:hypothetical protein
MMEEENKIDMKMILRQGSSCSPDAVLPSVNLSE